MANPEHLAILKQGVEVWNKWRSEDIKVKPDLSGADLSEANLSKANLSKANIRKADLRKANLSKANLNKANLSKVHFWQANLSGANLSGADLWEAYLLGANLRGADLRGAFLLGANLGGANLIGADLIGANLGETDLRLANLREANLIGANLIGATLVETDFSDTTLTACKIYGVSAWDVKLDENTKQNGLIITQEGQPVITVDNLEVAQFIYLLLNNSKLRNVINTVANKAVLILGRFGERKAILDSIADELRKKDYLPIMLDFDRPVDKTLTETVLTLAGLSKFVIAVMSDPKSVPHEAASIIPIFKIPFIPLIQEDQQVYSMFDDFKLNPWFIPPIQYKDSDHIKQLMESLLKTAEGKHKELRKLKAK
jgi:uncharacterized protein YjbI with pentapeptide repeats